MSGYFLGKHNLSLKTYSQCRVLQTPCLSGPRSRSLASGPRWPVLDSGGRGRGAMINCHRRGVGSGPGDSLQISVNNDGNYDNIMRRWHRHDQIKWFEVFVEQKLRLS